MPQPSHAHADLRILRPQGARPRDSVRIAGIVLVALLGIGIPVGVVAERVAGFLLVDRLPVWAWWVPDPLPILVIGAFGYWYAAGLRAWKKRSRTVHLWQVAAFYAGLALMLLGFVSPMAPLSDRMFSVHQFQHVVFRILGPLVIFLGAPVTPVLRGIPGVVRREVVRPVVSDPRVRRAYYWLTHPFFVPFAFMGLLFFWQIPVVHDVAIRDQWLHYLMHLTMIASGLLFWWIIVDPKPRRSRLHYGVRMLVLGLTILPNSMLGAIITLSGSLLYTGYGTTRPWGIAAINDQMWGGLILWLLPEMLTVVVAAVLFSLWYQRELSK